MTELGAVYRDIRERIIDLVGNYQADDLGRPVPACPEWTVHDTMSHISGVAADVISGNVEGVATDPWTAAQVDARRDWDTAKVLEEWAANGPQVDPVVPFFPGRVGAQLILDVTTHEHDIRHALGAPGAKDAEGVEIGLEMIVQVGLATGVYVRGLPPLELVAGDRRWVLGTNEPAARYDSDEAMAEAGLAEAGRVLMGGDPISSEGVTPAASLKIEPFELLRAATGRRSAAQIKAYDWSVDPTPYLALFSFGPFTTRPENLVE